MQNVPLIIPPSVVDTLIFFTRLDEEMTRLLFILHFRV